MNTAELFPDLAAGAARQSRRQVLPASKGEPAALVNYVGSKGAAGVWQTILNNIPPHEVWIEAFAGSAQITRRKRPAAQGSYLIDADTTVTAALARALPWATAIAGDAPAWLASWNYAAATVVYCDPPYLREARSCQRDYYRAEFATADEHRRLILVLRGLPCPVLLSGYRSALYDELLADWRRLDIPTVTHRGRRVTECLWTNFPAPTALHQYTQLGKDFRDRERIRRKLKRWRGRLLRLPALERRAILEALQ